MKIEMKITVRPDLDGLVKGLDKLKKLWRKRYDMIMESFARDVVGYAKIYAPVRTGTLKNSVGYRKLGHASYQVFVNTNYASYVEYGTISMGPQPFIRPAIDSARRNIIRHIDGLRVDLDKALHGYYSSFYWSEMRGFEPDAKLKRAAPKGI